MSAPEPGYAFPWEREAMQGAKMPDGLSLYDQMAYQAQYDYFKAGNSKKAFRHDARTTAVWGPLRSPYYNYYYNFSALGSGGSVYYYGAYYCGGLLAGFST